MKGYNKDAYQRLMRLVRTEMDGSDPWHSAMSMWFDIANELYLQGADVPAHWGYRPGAQSERNDMDSPLAPALAGVEAGALVRAGNVLERFTRLVGYEI